MKLTVLGSSSGDGNCYILENESEALIIELGVNLKKVKEALNFNLEKVVFAVASHEDGDHSKAVKAALDMGVKVVMSRGTSGQLGVGGHRRVVHIRHNQKYKSGNFEVMAFDTKHDCAEPLGFIIRHPEIGRICFITDSFYCEYVFPKIDFFMVECNYDLDKLNENVENGKVPAFLRDRVLSSHMSVDNCSDFLKAHDLSVTKKIILLHLSSKNSTPDFKDRIQRVTGKETVVAEPGLILSINSNPF